jgi:hypothetical protein
MATQLRTLVPHPLRIEVQHLSEIGLLPQWGYAFDYFCLALPTRAAKTEELL